MGAPQTPSLMAPPSRRMPRTGGARSRYVDTGFEAPSNDGASMPPPAPRPKAPPPAAMKIFTPSRPAEGEGGSSEGGYQAPSGYQPPSNEVGGEDEQAGAE